MGMYEFVKNHKPNPDSRLDQVGKIKLSQKGQSIVFDSLPITIAPRTEKLINSFYPRHHRYRKRVKHRKKTR